MRNKNLLKIIVGAALTQIRQSLHNSSIDYLASSIDVTPAYYRHIEGGFALLTTAKIYDLIEAFQEKIKIDSLVNILLTIQYIDTQIGYKGESNFLNNYLDAIEYLQLKFTNKFHQDYLSYLETKIPEISLEDTITQIREKCKSVGLVSNTRSYLQNGTLVIENALGSNEPKQSMSSNLTNLFLQAYSLPSVYINVLLENIDQLYSLPVSFAGKDTWKWENKYSNQFTHLSVLTDDIDLLYKSINKLSFRYEYLLSSEFKKMTIGIMSEETELESSKEKFIHRLLKLHKHASIELLTSKINFIRVNQERAKELLTKYSAPVQGLNEDQKVNYL